MGVAVSTTPYVPQPGTIAARVVAYLRTLPPGAMRSSAVIADELDFTGDIGPFMATAHEHGLVAREKRDGRLWWGISHPPLRTLAGPPAVNADDDDIDDAPIVQRVIPAARAGGVSLVDVPAWSPSAKESAVNKPATTATPPRPKKPCAAPIEFDPLAIELKRRPLPPAITSAGSRYQALLERMKPGYSVDVAPAIAKGLVSAAKKAKVKLATRAISDEITGVWRL